MPIAQRLILPIVLALAACVFGGVLLNDFVWDDHVLFVDNAALRSGSIDWTKLARPALEGTMYLRPLVLLTWALEYRLWGVNAFAAHAVNLGLHLLNIGLVFVVARRLLDERFPIAANWRAGLAGLIYAMHPALVEATSWVSGRFDLMATTFVLCALIADSSVTGPWRRSIILSALFALALGCKELALVLPPLVLVFRLVRCSMNNKPPSLWRQALTDVRNDWPTVVALGAVFAVWVVLRLQLFGAVVNDLDLTVDLPPEARLYTHALLVLNTVHFYTVQILLPFTRVGPLHPLQFELLTQPIGLLRALGGAGVIGCIGFLLVRRPVAGCLTLCTALALLPVLQIVPLLSTGESIGSDRFLTLPLTFVAIAVAAIPSRITERVGPRTQVLASGFVGGTWLLLSVATITVTVPLWRNEWVLWNWVYESHPESAYAQRAYVHAALHNGHYDRAGAVFDELRRKGPLHSFLQIQYGIYLLRTGDKEEAERYIKGAMSAYGIALDGTVALGQYDQFAINDRIILGYAYSALSEIEQERGNYETALVYMQEVVRYLPHVPMYRLIKAVLLIATNRIEEGKKLYAEAMEQILPSHRGMAVQVSEAFMSHLCRRWNDPPRPACARGLHLGVTGVDIRGNSAAQKSVEPAAELSSFAY